MPSYNPTFGEIKDSLRLAMNDVIDTSNPREVRLVIGEDVVSYAIVTITKIELDNMRYINRNDAEDIAAGQIPPLHNYFHMLEDVMPEVLQQYNQPDGIQWMDLSSDKQGKALLAYNRTFSVLLIVDKRTVDDVIPTLQ